MSHSHTTALNQAQAHLSIPGSLSIFSSESPREQVLLESHWPKQLRQRTCPYDPELPPLGACSSSRCPVSPTLPHFALYPLASAPCEFEFTHCLSHQIKSCSLCVCVCACK